MDDLSFDERMARLSSNLRETAELLRLHGETRWTSWATACAAQLADHDPAAFDRVLAAFGGMGSLNDLVIDPVNGHAAQPGEEAAANDRLELLREAVREDATVLRHDLRSSP